MAMMVTVPFAWFPDTSRHYQNLIIDSQPALINIILEIFYSVHVLSTSGCFKDRMALKIEYMPILGVVVTFLNWVKKWLK